MKLSGYLGSPSAVSDLLNLRDLTADELKHHALYKSIVAEAKNRLTLFRVLDDNHRQWADCVKSLLHPEPVNDDATVLELERLLLNYLTCAHHIRLHFEGSFQQRFRTDSAEQKKYKMQLDQLTQTTWVFAFFLDFRNYLQHQGLGLGFYKRKLTPTSVSLELTLNAAELLNTTKDWPRSKLTPAKGIMELTALLRDFHAVMMQKYSVIIVSTLFADLPPAADFYKKLAAEVSAKDPARTIAFNDNGKTVFVPNDLMAELGLAGVVKK